MKDTALEEGQGRTVKQRPNADEMLRGSGAVARLHSRRIALLTPYNGGNFGDAAIQDAVIANLRLRLPDVRVAGITLGSENFLQRHGTDAFPLCASTLPFYAMGSPLQTEPSGLQENQVVPGQSGGWGGLLKRLLRKIPGARLLGKKLQSLLATAGREIRHFRDGYRFLQTQDLLVVSGGGQLDEEWGGPWGHPYYLLKWAVLAKLARIPFVIVSVGAGKTSASLSRVFLSMALRSANYRSYREVHSRKIAAKWFPGAVGDRVVPDLAFSLPTSALPEPAGLRSLAQGRTIVALSPIAYAKRGVWPQHDQALYARYKSNLVQVVCELLARGYFLVFLWSSLGEDNKVVSEILDSLDDACKAQFERQIYIPAISSWKELVAVLQDVDYLVASRLHSMILAFVTKTPAVAISFDPKIDWLMQDLGQTEYLLQIGNFAVDDVIQTLERLMVQREDVVSRVVSYRERVAPMLSLQYDALAKLALATQDRNEKSAQ